MSIAWYGDTITEGTPYSGEAGRGWGVPGKFHISVGTRSYEAETSFEPFRHDAFRSDSIIPVAEKSDITNIPGAGSVGTDGLWRREMYDYESGGGQLFLDRHGSIDSRFLQSKGVYVWQPWEMSLLNDVMLISHTGTETQVMAVGTSLYKVDNGNLFVTNAIKEVSESPAWTAITGPPAGSVLNIAHDASDVYLACGADGVYILQPGGSAPTVATSWITCTTPDEAQNIWFAGGYIFISSYNSIFQPSLGIGGAPVDLQSSNPSGPLMTHPNANFIWTAATSGNAWVYLAGGVPAPLGNMSCIYKTCYQTTPWVGFIIPIVAASLTPGEYVTGLYCYTNFIQLGSSLGSRFCETLGADDPTGNPGDLKLGPIVPDLIQQVTYPVTSFCAQGRFIWFNWSPYDSESTGLGRMDLSTFIDEQAPAYTSDLLVPGCTAPVVSMDWYEGTGAATLVGMTKVGSPVFVVQHTGIYTAKTTTETESGVVTSYIVPSGTLDTGYMTFGIPDQKLCMYCDWNAVGAGTVGMLIDVDDGTQTYQTVPQQASGPAEQVTTSFLRGELIKAELQLIAENIGTEDAPVCVSGPTVRRLMVKAFPAIVSGTYYKTIINLFRFQQTETSETECDPYAEVEYLDNLRLSATPVLYVEGTKLAIPVIIKGVTRLIYSEFGLPEGGFNLRVELIMQSLEG